MDTKNYNLVIYGDSISKGVVFDEDKERYVVLEKNFCNIIKEKFNGVLYNAAKFGSTITRGLKNLPLDIATKKPDIVVLEFGGNDCDFNWEEVGANPKGLHQPNTDLDTFKETLINTVNSLINKGINPVLMTLPPLDADRYFKWISKNCAEMEKNILQWLGSIQMIYTWQEKYSSAVQAAAKETKSRWIDIRSAFLKTKDYRQYLCKDGIHPNKQGHMLIADKILEYIKGDYTFLLKIA
jgi:lysophospholipase L1-like esterase